MHYFCFILKFGHKICIFRRLSTKNEVAGARIKLGKSQTLIKTSRSSEQETHLQRPDQTTPDLIFENETNIDQTFLSTLKLQLNSCFEIIFHFKNSFSISYPYRHTAGLELDSLGLPTKSRMTFSKKKI